MPAYLTSMPAGIPGDVTRALTARIESVLVGAADIPFGSPVQINAEGTLVPATDPDAAVYGFLVRPYPTQSGMPADDAPGAGGGKAGSMGNVLRSGYMTVRLSAAEAASPAKGAPVCIVYAPTGSYLAGDLAVSQGAALPGCTFMGGKDAAGNAEIVYNI